jgi:hypothetical protein
MSSFKFQELPGYQEALNNIAAGRLDGRGEDDRRGMYSDVPWDFGRTYHVEIIEGTTKVANSTQNLGLSFTCRVIDDPTYKDKRIWLTIWNLNKPGDRYTTPKISVLSSAAPSGPFKEDLSWDVFAARCVGAKLHISIEPSSNPKEPGDEQKYAQLGWVFEVSQGQEIRLVTEKKGPKKFVDVSATDIPGLAAAQAAKSPMTAAQAAPAAAPAPVSAVLTPNVEQASEAAPTPVVVEQPVPAPEVAATATTRVLPPGIKLPGGM